MHMIPQSSYATAIAGWLVPTSELHSCPSLHCHALPPWAQRFAGAKKDTAAGTAAQGLALSDKSRLLLQRCSFLCLLDDLDATAAPSSSAARCMPRSGELHCATGRFQLHPLPNCLQFFSHLQTSRTASWFLASPENLVAEESVKGSCVMHSQHLCKKVVTL